MDPIHFHLLLNHVPVFGTFFAVCLLLFGMIRKNKTLEQAGLITLMVVAVVTVPVFLSGENAEHKLEKIADVSEHFMEEHEESAEFGLWLMMATGVSALFSLRLLSKTSQIAEAMRMVTLALAMFTVGAMIAIGSHGGKIRHDELRSDQQKVIPAVQHHSDDDDD